MEMFDEQIVTLTKTDDDIDQPEAMKTACGLFLTAEGSSGRSAPIPTW